MSSIVLLTPTCARDRERFRLLRTSLRAFGTAFHHVVVVDRGDDPTSYLDPADTDVEVLTIDDVLPADLARRATRPIRRRDPRYWVQGHWRDEPRLAGWTLQQVIKLASTRLLGPDRTIVCLDSDLFLLQPMQASWFRSDDGRSRLFESADTEAEMLGWELAAMDQLGVPRRAHAAARHTFEPNVLDAGVGAQLLDELEASSGRPWWGAFLAGGLTEYALYGSFARFCVPPGTLEATPPIPIYQARNHYDPAEFAAGLRAGADGAPMGMVRSALGVEPSRYADLLHQAWDRG